MDSSYLPNHLHWKVSSLLGLEQLSWTYVYLQACSTYQRCLCRWHVLPIQTVWPGVSHSLGVQWIQSPNFFWPSFDSPGISNNVLGGCSYQCDHFFGFGIVIFCLSNNLTWCWLFLLFHPAPHQTPTVKISFAWHNTVSGPGINHYDGINYSNDFAALFPWGVPMLHDREARTSLSHIPSNGHATSLVPSLHLWTDILNATIIYMPYA